jgi:ribulose-phosphate 3-epimerase
MHYVIVENKGVKMIKIYPSLMAANPTDLHKEIGLLQPFCAGFHLDIMDNIFVPNEFWNNPDEVNSLVKMMRSAWLHLMVEKPALFYENLSLPLGTLVSFHIESNVDIFSFAKTIKEKKHRVSIAIRPKTAVSEIIPFFSVADQILLMSVDPGFSGQQFLDNTYERLAELVEYRTQHNAHFRIGLDGGIAEGNIQKLVRGGGDEFAIATAIFQARDHVAALQELQKLTLISP